MDTFDLWLQSMGVDAGTVAQIGGFVLLLTQIIKTQFPGVKGLYTTLISIGLCLVAAWLSLSTYEHFSVQAFVGTVLGSWVVASGAKSVLKSVFTGQGSTPPLQKPQ